MQHTIKQSQTSIQQHLAAPGKGSAVCARKLQNNMTAKMVLGLRFTKFASAH